MTSPLRGMAILASSLLWTALAGLATAKAWALLLGPIGIGRRALLRNPVALSGLIAGLGIGAALVRTGATALPRAEIEHPASPIRAAALLAGLLGCLGTIVLITFKAPISRMVLGDNSDGNSVGDVPPAVEFEKRVAAAPWWA